MDHISQAINHVAYTNQYFDYDNKYQQFKVALPKLSIISNFLYNTLGISNDTIKMELELDNKKGRVILHKGCSDLLEVGRFYAVNVLDEIDDIIKDISIYGIPGRTKETPDIIEILISMLDDYFIEILDLNEELEIMYYENIKIKDEKRNAILDLDICDNIIRNLYNEIDRLRGKINIKKFFSTTMKLLYSSFPGSLQCSICMEEIDTEQLQITDCGHIFCYSCFSINKESTNKCAVCRISCKGIIENNITDDSSGQEPSLESTPSYDISNIDIRNIGC